MSAPVRRAVVVAVVVLSALGLGGCRGADRVAEPTRTAVERPGVPGGVRGGGGGSLMVGFVGGFFAFLRDLDADSAVAR